MISLSDHDSLWPVMQVNCLCWLLGTSVQNGEFNSGFVSLFAEDKMSASPQLYS